MFQQLIESIHDALLYRRASSLDDMRHESAQSGGSKPKVKQAHSYKGRMLSPSWKKSDLKMLKSKSRRQGKKLSLMPSAEPQ